MIRYYETQHNRIWYDPSYKRGDLNAKEMGTLQYIAYVAGAGADEADVSFKLDGKYPPMVYMFGHDEIPLDRVERTLAKLGRILDDPRVQQARAEYAAMTAA